MHLSIIIPVLNEAGILDNTLQCLQPLRDDGHEIIVVDGGSRDDSVDRARRHADRVLQSPSGRARQMNRGAAVARGDILLFLHADTRLPATAVTDINQPRAWGRFDVRFEPDSPLFRLIARSMNLRSRLSGIATGDQAIFVQRTLFRQLGGYPEIALMEDIALSRALKAVSRPLCLTSRVTTSSRRWRRHGPLKTVARMWTLRLAYRLGADPAVLAKAYRPEDH